MFYTYRHNNSVGFYSGPKYVIVEANSAEQADEIALNGDVIYFGGCSTGMDCSCCGDRWHSHSTWDDPHENVEDAISYCRQYVYDPQPEDEILIIENLEGYEYEHMVGLCVQ